MKSDLSKKLLATALTGLFLVSIGASAAEPTTEKECKKAGGTWHPTTMTCTKKEK